MEQNLVIKNKTADNLVRELSLLKKKLVFFVKKEKELKAMWEDLKLKIHDLSKKSLVTRDNNLCKRAETIFWHRKITKAKKLHLQKHIIDLELETLGESSLCLVDVVNEKPQVSVLADTVSKSVNHTANLLQAEMHHLAVDFRQLFESKNHCDVVLNVNGHEFKAHKAVLAARSPVFAAMFEHEMIEKKKNRVEITDIDSEVFKEMLYFIYTESAPNLSKIAEGLFVAADKYALNRLKVMCGDALHSTLSVENVSDVLILADTHSAPWLKTQIYGFLFAHLSDVMKTNSWKSLIAHWPHLFREALEAVSAQIDTLEA